MPIVDTKSCVSSKPEFFEKFTTNKTFCAGYKNGTSVCNGDSGGGMFFRNENVWYLRGIVSVSLALQRKYCDPHNYVVFTDLAAYIDFVQSNIIRP
ncbi:PREDICTED: serine protease gd-like [Nicrophorus vespilloides]|uniref:Serine protease gd-like n=1 Tax=Nicrophorus vespilloides TaxID=110193 RepID=A0ABM1M142_NICVS|nr:PREDICTED: serine protease gd-like [Nicrophorus vespilloides]